MSESTVPADENPSGFDAIIGAYQDAVGRGLSPRSPRVAGPPSGIGPALAEFFEGQARLDRVISPSKRVIRRGDPERMGTNSIVVDHTEGPGSPEQAAVGGQGHEHGAETLAAEIDQRSGSRDDRRIGAPLVRLGDFELIQPLGRGAMGVVYEARQLSLNRLVAIKTIRAGVFATEAEVQRFRNEAEAVAQLDHPRIVPIHEVGKIGDCHYFSMKLLPGGSLAHRLETFRADPLAAVSVVIEVARAIQHAHQRGVLHRDLKPANILLDENGQPQVTDFGLAKRFGEDSSLTESGAIMGTPSYMAPEQARGRRASSRR